MRDGYYWVRSPYKRRDTGEKVSGIWSVCFVYSLPDRGQSIQYFGGGRDKLSDLLGAEFKPIEKPL